MSEFNPISELPLSWRLAIKFLRGIVLCLECSSLAHAQQQMGLSKQPGSIQTMFKNSPSWKVPFWHSKYLGLMGFFAYIRYNVISMRSFIGVNIHKVV